MGDPDTIVKLMKQYYHKHADITLDDGYLFKGHIDEYESRADNDGEACICVSGDNGERVCIGESEILDIVLS